MIVRTNGATVIDARNLSKRFELRHNRNLSIKSRVVGLFDRRQRETVETFWALRDVSVAIGRGEQVGLIGRNGSGKSTLLKLIAGIHRPTSGQLLVERGATIGTMIELGVGFHPDLTGTENVFLNAAIHGRSHDEIQQMYPSVVEYSGLAHFMDVPLKNFSSGMHMRLGFAIAANLEPDVILLDEVFAVGDEDFQRKCMTTMDRFASEGRTIIFVSHAMSAVRKMCRRLCVLDGGRLVFDGDVESGISAYYKLLSAPDVPASRDASRVDADTTADLPTLARRQMSAWALDLLKREGLGARDRVLEIGTEAAPDPLSPLRQHVGPDRYAFWQAGAADPDELGRAETAVAATVFMHFPLQTIARTLASVLQHLTPEGRLYATFFEARGMDAFTTKAWPAGFVTSSDTLPYHCSFEMIQAVATAFGATVRRVPGATHPNGETTIVIIAPPARRGAEPVE